MVRGSLKSGVPSAPTIAGYVVVLFADSVCPVREQCYVTRRIASNGVVDVDVHS